MLTINPLMNRIHEWGEPEKNPLSRIALTRLGSISCAVLEAAGLVFSLFESAYKLYGVAAILTEKMCSHFYDPKDLKQELSELKSALLNVGKLIAGIASTILIGIVFSSEINFRFHLKLGLAVDNLAIKKQKALKAKLEAQERAAEITRERNAHIAAREANELSTKTAQEQAKAIDTRLAELLMLQSCGHT